MDISSVPSAPLRIKWQERIPPVSVFQSFHVVPNPVPGLDMCGKWPRIDRISKQPSVHYIVIASTARTEEMIQGHTQMRLKSVLD